MPIYEYKCPSCGLKYEFLVDSDKLDKECRCGAILLKVPSTSSFVIKGFSEKNGYSK